MSFIRGLLIVLALLASPYALADDNTANSDGKSSVVANDDGSKSSGVIPIAENTAISFAKNDITQNFTDQYRFSLQGTDDVSYAVKWSLSACEKGCGNPDISYGVYNAKGELISDSGSAVLKAGEYVFQVKGTGMGSGNSLDYSGSVNYFVSAVPEPGDVLLMLAGLSCLAWAVMRRKRTDAHSGTGAYMGGLSTCPS